MRAQDSHVFTDKSKRLGDAYFVRVGADIRKYDIRSYDSSLVIYANGVEWWLNFGR